MTSPIEPLQSPLPTRSARLAHLMRRPLTAAAFKRLVYILGLYRPGGRVVRALAYHVNVAESEHRPASVHFAKVGGIRMAVTLDDWHSSLMYFCGSSARNGRFVHEPETTAFVSRWLRAGDTFLDVGANVGHFTFIAAGLVGATGHVYAFEPQPRVASLLEMTVAVNLLAGRVHVEQVALAAEEGAVTLHPSREPRTTGTASITASPFANSAAGTVVRALTLDAVARREKLSAVRLIKIDVEGAETKVLAGAHELLSRVKPEVLIIEFNTLIAGNSAGELWGALCGPLARYGYSPFLLSQDGRLLDCPEAPCWEWGNVCFVHEQSDIGALLPLHPAHEGASPTGAGVLPRGAAQEDGSRSLHGES